MTKMLTLTPEAAKRIWHRYPLNNWGHVTPAWHSAQFEIAQYEINKPSDVVMGMFDALTLK